MAAEFHHRGRGAARAACPVVAKYLDTAVAYAEQLPLFFEELSDVAAGGSNLLEERGGISGAASITFGQLPGVAAGSSRLLEEHAWPKCLRTSYSRNGNHLVWGTQ